MVNLLPNFLDSVPPGDWTSTYADSRGGRTALLHVPTSPRHPEQLEGGGAAPKAKETREAAPPPDPAVTCGEEAGGLLRRWRAAKMESGSRDSMGSVWFLVVTVFLILSSRDPLDGPLSPPSFSREDTIPPSPTICVVPAATRKPSPTSLRGAGGHCVPPPSPPKISGPALPPLHLHAHVGLLGRGHGRPMSPQGSLCDFGIEGSRSVPSLLYVLEKELPLHFPLSCNFSAMAEFSMICTSTFSLVGEHRP